MSCQVIEACIRPILGTICPLTQQGPVWDLVLSTDAGRTLALHPGADNSLKRWSMRPDEDRAAALRLQCKMQARLAALYESMRNAGSGPRGRAAIAWGPTGTLFGAGTPGPSSLATGLPAGHALQDPPHTAPPGPSLPPAGLPAGTAVQAQPHTLPAGPASPAPGLPSGHAVQAPVCAVPQQPHTSAALACSNQRQDAVSQALPPRPQRPPPQPDLSQALPAAPAAACKAPPPAMPAPVVKAPPPAKPYSAPAVKAPPPAKPPQPAPEPPAPKRLPLCMPPPPQVLAAAAARTTPVTAAPSLPPPPPPRARVDLGLLDLRGFR